jgi:hypothetical protein
MEPWPSTPSTVSTHPAPQAASTATPPFTPAHPCLPHASPPPPHTHTHLTPTGQKARQTLEEPNLLINEVEFKTLGFLPGRSRQVGTIQPVTGDTFLVRGVGGVGEGRQSGLREAGRDAGRAGMLPPRGVLLGGWWRRCMCANAVIVAVAAGCGQPTC